MGVEKQLEEAARFYGYPEDGPSVRPLAQKALSAIAALKSKLAAAEASAAEAESERMREALRPFAAYGAIGVYGPDDRRVVSNHNFEDGITHITVGDFRRAAAALADTATDTAGAGAGEVRWRHVKRGSEYVEVGRASVQVARSHHTIVEGDTVVVYRGEDGRLWARHETEFEDGRFVRALASADTGGRT